MAIIWRPIMSIGTALLMCAPTQTVAAQVYTEASDTAAVIRAVLDHIRASFPRDSVVIDTRSASGRPLPIDSLARSIGAELGAEEDVVPCRGATPDTCYLRARLLVRIDSVFLGKRTAEVYVQPFSP